MLKIEQIKAQISEPGWWNISNPLNKFIQELPQKGQEIRKITYFPDRNNMGVRCAVVEYQSEEGGNPNAN